MTAAMNESAHIATTIGYADGAFYFFALLILGCGFIVAFSRNIVHAGFALLGTFAGVAGLYALAAADFLAAAQILVYVGGVLIIILFAVMLTRGIQQVELTNLSIGVIPSVTLALIILAILTIIAFQFPWQVQIPQETPPTTAQMGQALLTQYLVPFEIVSILLLAALVGSVMLVRKEIKPDSTQEVEK